MLTFEIDYLKSQYIIDEEVFSFGTFLIDFLELDICSFFNELSVFEDRGKNPFGREYYHAKILPEHQAYLESVFPKHVTRVILHHLTELINLFLKQSSKSYIEIRELLIEEYLLIRNELVKVLFEPGNSSYPWFEPCEVRAFFGLKKDGAGTPYCLYVIDTINSLISVELFCLRCNSIHVKACENCGHYFIPSKRTDEIYCDRIFKSGKTCKEVGYAEKEKKDPIKSLYTTARKTQHARIRYNAHISDYKEKHFEPWKKAAEKARDEFQKTNDVEGFKKWLDENKDRF